MWFLIAPVCVLAPFAYLAAVRAVRLRKRSRRMLLGELADVARIAADPLRVGEIAFTGPHRCDGDRTHDTMFTARHGHRLLSFILDTSGWRIRWWILFEIFSPEGAGGGRSLRLEATFVESAIPHEPIRILLKAARGEIAPAAAPAPSPPPPDVHVDPFDTLASDPTSPAAQT